MIDNQLLNLLKKKSELTFVKGLTAAPVKVVPIVTQADAAKKVLTRYFVRQVNDKLSSVEIDKKQYDQFKLNPRFIVTSFDWKIVGKQDTEYLPSGVPIYGVADTNRQTVATEDLTFEGLRSYITNYLEFWVSEK